jgi:hypothetical protein
MAQDIRVRQTAANGSTVTGAALTWSQLDANFNAIGPMAVIKFGAIGIGTEAGIAGSITATSTITAYYSDERLKDFKGKIPDALDKVLQLNGYYFTENVKAKELGYTNDRLQVGVSAQEVEKVLPEIVTTAPISDEYKTIWYDKLTPLLIEAIKDLKIIIDKQQAQIDDLQSKLV